tara:strand:- start:105 stop:767 length:663 start_codon:yes stop_codon:yes gene_type:complete
MRVLVACEFSGTVRDAFIARGHDAMSCDLMPTEVPGPHYEGSVLDVLDDGWDLMIAHPPCTYLSKAGARWLYPKAGVMDEGRYRKGMEARDFFMKLLHAPIPKVAIENPTPLRAFRLPPPTQAIEPYHHGHSFSKKTLLWLRGLPHLNRTKTVENYEPFLPSNTGYGASQGQKTSRGVVRGGMDASRTFKGIAKAMAAQWGDGDMTGCEPGAQFSMEGLW